MKTNIIKCIAILMLLCLLPTRMWADESFEGSFAWDLTTDNSSLSSQSVVKWECGGLASMELNSGSSTTRANRYIGTDNSYTKFCAGHILSIIPQTIITSKIIIDTYLPKDAKNLEENLKSNGNIKSIDINETHFEITPQNGNITFSINITEATCVTRIEIEYFPGSYTRTGLQQGDYATMCLPFGSTDFTGAEFYNIAGVTKSGDEITGIALEPVSALEAGKPYIFKATDTQQVINLSGTCQETPVAATGLVGNLSEIPIEVNSEKNAYIIGDDNLIHLITGSATAKIKQYRAYIKLDDVPEASSESPARLDIFDASAIHNITNDADQQQEVFDLQGRKLMTPQKGLNVIDGKKVIINK